MAMADVLPVQRSDLADLPTELANALVREFMEIPEDDPYWHAEEWNSERAILNRIFRMGQCHARDKTALAAGKD